MGRHEELESLEVALVSKNHILQSEVLELRGENKHLQDALETLKKLSDDKINKLTMENTALKNIKSVQNTPEQEIKVEAFDAKRKRKPKREFLLKILFRILKIRINLYS